MSIRHMEPFFINGIGEKGGLSCGSVLLFSIHDANRCVIYYFRAWFKAFYSCISE